MIDLKNYKRLTTKKKERNIVYGNCDANNDSDFKGDYITGTIIDKIAELEDMIEQGKLVLKIEPKTVMTKEQQIQEMANIIANACPDLVEDNCAGIYCVDCLAEKIYNAGYRKKEEIEKQVAKEIYKKVLKCYKDPDYNPRNPYDCNALVAYNRIMVIIKRDYGIEVDE